MSAAFGIIHGEPLEVYHAFDAVSSTRLMDMRPCEKYYYLRHVAKTLPKESKTCFDLGNGAHWLILEGRKALEERTVLQPATYPAKGGETKPWHNGADHCKAWIKGWQGMGKIVLTAADFATIDRMAKAVEENPDAVALLTGGESEVTFRVQHPAFAVQCRADHWHATFIEGPLCVDLKTCESIEQFRAHYWKMRYFYRAAFYLDVISDCIGAVHRPAFAFVALEKNPPFRCEVFQPSEIDIDLGRAEVLADLKLLRNCFETGQWANSKLGVQLIELTEWQRKNSAASSVALFEEVA
jgi:hypothetical protein